MFQPKMPEYLAVYLYRQVEPRKGTPEARALFHTFKASCDVGAYEEAQFELTRLRVAQQTPLEPPFWNTYELVCVSEVQHLPGQTIVRKIRNELFEFYWRHAA